MPPISLRSPHAVASEALVDWGPAKEPIGAPTAHIRSTEKTSGPGGRDRVGIWECTPGRWRRQVMEREFAHFISGSGRFLPDDGEPLEIQAGNSMWFPAYTTGTWEITETLRKSYVIVGFSAMEKLRAFIGRKLGALGRMFAAPPVRQDARTHEPTSA